MLIAEWNEANNSLKSVSFNLHLPVHPWILMDSSTEDTIITEIKEEWVSIVNWNCFLELYIQYIHKSTGLSKFSMKSFFFFSLKLKENTFKGQWPYRTYWLRSKEIFII